MPEIWPGAPEIWPALPEIWPAKAEEDNAKVMSEAQRVIVKRFIFVSPGFGRLRGRCAGGDCHFAMSNLF